MGIAGIGNGIKVFTEKGICNDFSCDTFPSISEWQGPISMAHLKDSIIGCGKKGENPCEPHPECVSEANDCYKFNTTNPDEGWIQINNPYDVQHQRTRFGPSNYLLCLSWALASTHKFSG